MPTRVVSKRCSPGFLFLVVTAIFCLSLCFMLCAQGSSPAHGISDADGFGGSPQADVEGELGTSSDSLALQTESDGRDMTPREECDDPWSTLGVPHPATGIHVDLSAAKQRFEMLYRGARNAGASIVDLQGLYHAYLAVLFSSAFLKARDTRSVQAVVQASNEDVQSIIRQLEKDRNSFADHAARMEHWGQFLKGDLEVAKKRVQELDRELSSAIKRASKAEELERQLGTAAVHARLVPPWFGVLSEFVESRCIQGDNERVAGSELHQAFLDFLVSRDPEVPAPPHKEFKEILVRLGFHYCQLYVSGDNKRGFKGIGLINHGTDARGAQGRSHTFGSTQSIR